LLFFVGLAFSLGASVTGASSAPAALTFLPCFFGLSCAFGTSATATTDSGASPLVSAVVALVFFLPLVGFTVSFAGSATAAASSSEKKSAASLRAGLALAGLDLVAAGTGLAAFAGFGAAAAATTTSSDFLGFFALGAASEAPVDAR
jgi:hypothetical protein